MCCYDCDPQAYIIFGLLTLLPLVLLLPIRAANGGHDLDKAGEEEKEEEGGRRDVPWSVELLMYAAFFTYVAAEVGFGGWLATVLLAEGRTASKAQAAFCVSVFWGAITIGES